MGTDFRWEAWEEPATKGDLIRVAVFTRSCLIDIQSAIAAINRADPEGSVRALEKLQSDSDELLEIIHGIGRKVDI